MYSNSEENYLKAIYHLSSKEEDGVSTNAIAEQLNSKASSVTEMLKKMAQKKLLNYVKYKGVTLTPKGNKSALNIIRKHRLWEYFLVEKLDFNWDEVHEIAEQLEHINSEVLTEKLEVFLGHPKFDPHGHPIPTEEGNFPERDTVLLSELNEKEEGICVGVKDSSSVFLKYLNKINIALGKSIKVIEKESFDKSVLLQIDHEKITISHQTASNLLIKKSNSV